MLIRDERLPDLVRGRGPEGDGGDEDVTLDRDDEEARVRRYVAIFDPQLLVSGQVLPL